MKAQQVCDDLVSDLQMLFKDSIQFTEKQLELVIMRKRGIDERTTRRWIKALVAFGYVKQVSPHVYALASEYVPLIAENTQLKLMK